MQRILLLQGRTVTTKQRKTRKRIKNFTSIYKLSFLIHFSQNSLITTIHILFCTCSKRGSYWCETMAHAGTCSLTGGCLLESTPRCKRGFVWRAACSDRRALWLSSSFLKNLLTLSDLQGSSFTKSTALPSSLSLSSLDIISVTKVFLHFSRSSSLNDILLNSESLSVSFYKNI